MTDHEEVDRLVAVITVDCYNLNADMAIKQAPIDRTRPPNVKPGTYQPEPDILAWLTSL